MKEGSDIVDTVDDRVKYAAMEAGRRYLELCAEMNGVTIGEFVDNMLACEAVGCDEAGSAMMELSFQVANALPLDVDIPDEHWSQWCDDVVQWCYDVEDEFRTRPRPIKSLSQGGGRCLLEDAPDGWFYKCCPACASDEKALKDVDGEP